MQGGQFDGFIAIGALRDHVEFAVSFQQGPQTAPDERMIVDDQNAGRGHVFQHTRSQVFPASNSGNGCIPLATGNRYRGA